MKKKKGFSRFSVVMLILSIIAVLMGVAVFYWLMNQSGGREVASLIIKSALNLNTAV